MVDQNITARFDEIYSNTSKDILAFITAKCGNTADISDIVQDTYLELYKVLLKHGADYITNDKAFVTRIAKHKIARYYTLLQRLKNIVSLDNKAGEENFDIDSFSLEDYAVDKVMLNQAREFILSKPEPVKKVFYLFYESGMSINEIAEMLCISESNVKNKLYRTLNELKQLLKGE